MAGRLVVSYLVMNSMKIFLAFVVLFAVTTQMVSSQTVFAQSEKRVLNGRWRIKFSLTGGAEKNIVFESKPHGMGNFFLLDTGPDNKPVPDAQPAVWSQIENGRVSLSGNVELPLGTCCREVGTLIFKGTYASDNSIKGRAIFITSTTDEENFIGFRSDVGAFTATREP